MCLFKLSYITLSRVITATILFLQLYLSPFVGTLKYEILGAALELCQLKIEHFSAGILKFRTKHDDNPFTLNLRLRSSELSNQTQYLYLELDSFNNLKCLKNHLLYLKLILKQSRDISLNLRPNQTNQTGKKIGNLKVFKNRVLNFIHLNMNTSLYLQWKYKSE